MNGRRVIPGEGGHGFTGPPVLALDMSFNMPQHRQAEAHIGNFLRLRAVLPYEFPRFFISGVTFVDAEVSPSELL